jgi:hypothetical protein
MNGARRNKLIVAVILASLSCRGDQILAPDQSITPARLVLATPLGSAATSGIVLAMQPVVNVLDARDRLARPQVQVVAEIASGSGRLVGTTAVFSEDGVARFTDLRVDGAGPHTLRFSTPHLAPALTETLTVSQTAVALGVEVQPDGGETGLPLKSQPVVLVRDHAGLLMQDASVAVTAAIVSGSGVLSGTTTVLATGGVATFRDLVITGGGAHALGFTARGLTAAAMSGPATPAVEDDVPNTTSNDFAVADVTQLVITQQPANATLNAPFGQQPVVELRGDSGGVMTGSSAAITAAIASGDGTLSGVVTVNAVNGVATFTDLRLNAAGPHTLVFSSDTVLDTRSDTVIVTAPPVALAIETQPGGAVSGRALSTQPVVSLRDGANQLAGGSTAAVTVALSSGTGTLAGTTTMNAVAGTVTFTDLRIDGTGPHTLVFTSAGLSEATSMSVTVTQVPARLVVETQPTGGESGQPLTTQPSVRVLDHAGLSIEDATTSVSVTATIETGTGALTGTTTVSAVNGVATFTDLRIDGGGTHRLDFTAPSVLGAVSNSFAISQTAVALGIQTQPGGGTSGLAFASQPVIQVRDAVNAVVVGSTAAVTATITSGPGSLSGTATVTAVNGVARFLDLQVDSPGSYTISFATPDLPTVTSVTFSVSQPPVSLALETQPNGAVSGQRLATQPVVSFRDPANELAGGVTAPVTASLASGSGALAGTTTVNAVGGVASFEDLRLNGSGPHTIVFTSAGMTSATASSVVVTQAPAALAMETQPTGAHSGAPLATQPAVRVLDHAGLPIADAAESITATIASGSGSLVGTTTVTAVGGVATFADLRVLGGGAHTLRLTSPGLTGATSNSFTIAQTAVSLAIQTQPAGAATGQPLATQPVIEVRDSANALVRASAAPITVTVAAGPGSLMGTTTAMAVDGIATFTDLRLDAPGAYTLSFSSPDLAAATSVSFTVGQAAASLAMVTQPNGAESGMPLTTQPVVRILDHAGQPIDASGTTVTAVLSSGTGTLVGTRTVTATNGVATFTTLRIDGSGSHTFTFTATDLSPTSSAPLSVTQTPVALAVPMQPGGAVSGMRFVAQPEVHIRDRAGLPVVGESHQVSVSIANGAGALSGTTPVPTVNGVARFTDLLITGTGAHTLRFTSGSLETMSAGFQVSAGSSFPLHPSCQEYPTPIVPSPLRTFYVDGNNGNDAADGTSSVTAWRTLSRANSMVQPGDLILLRGVFSGQSIRPATSGTASAKIVYRVVPNDSARITLGQSGFGILLEGVHHVVVDGVEISNVSNPFHIRLNSSNNWLLNLFIRDGGGSFIGNSDDNRVERSRFLRIGTRGANSRDAILIEDGSDRNVIVRNIIGEASHGTVWLGSGTSLVPVNDNVIAQNDTFNPWASGMGLGARAVRTVVECNRIRDAAPAAGTIPPREGIDIDGLNNIIRYNEIYQNGGFGLTVKGRTYASNPQNTIESQIFENTIWGNGLGAIRVVLSFQP